MPATVLYDNDCGLCTRSKQIFERLDWLHRFRWLAIHQPETARYGIPPEELAMRMYVIAGDRRIPAFSAWKYILLRTPLFYALAALAIWAAWWSALPIVLFFTPVFQPIGDRVYAWVARNRYRLPGATCRRPD